MLQHHIQQYNTVNPWSYLHSTSMFSTPPVLQGTDRYEIQDSEVGSWHPDIVTWGTWTYRIAGPTGWGTIHLCVSRKNPRENAGNNSKMDDRYAKRMRSSKEFELIMETSWTLMGQRWIQTWICLFGSQKFELHPGLCLRVPMVEGNHPYNQQKGPNI